MENRQINFDTDETVFTTEYLSNIGLSKIVLNKKLRQLNLPPSYFSNGCICGHNICHRDCFTPLKTKILKYEGYNPKTKVPPVNIYLLQD